MQRSHDQLRWQGKGNAFDRRLESYHAVADFAPGAKQTLADWQLLWGRAGEQDALPVEAPRQVRFAERPLPAPGPDDVVLRARGVERLVLAGIATSGVVLSTLRAAADLDFAVTVLRDGCADADPEVDRVLQEKVFPRQADVVTIDEWVAALGSA